MHNLKNLKKYQKEDLQAVKTIWRPTGTSQTVAAKQHLSNDGGQMAPVKGSTYSSGGSGWSSVGSMSRIAILVAGLLYDDFALKILAQCIISSLPE